MRTWRRRAFGILVVTVTATLAIAAAMKDAGGAFITANPSIVGIRNQVGNQVVGTIALANGSSTPFTVGSITYSCDSAMQLVNGSGGSAFMIGGGSAAMIAVDCPASLPVGMHRCTFTVKDTANFAVLSFLGFCETFDQPLLGANPSNLVFPSTPLGQESAPLAVMIGNSSMTTPVPVLQLQVDNDNFLVGTPCQNSLGCDAGPIPAMGMTPVNVICKPNSPGTHTGNLYVVGNNGFSLMTAPIPLSCPTGSGAGNPILTLTPPNVLFGGIEVSSGNDNATIVLKNGGTFGSLTIDTLTLNDAGIAGAKNDWSFTIDGACPVLPCPLGPQAVLNVRLTFDPSAIGQRPAELLVNYTDPDGTQQATAPLSGTGNGATLELVSTGAIDFGVVPVSTTSMMQSFTLRNQGNRQTTATLSASPAAPFLFPATVTVDPGVDTQVDVVCFSATEVAANRTLTISGPDAPVPNETQTLICDVRDTSIVASPSAIPLGERRIGTTVPSQLIDITKSGASEVPLVSAQLETSDSNLSLAGQTPFLSQLMTPANTSLVVATTSEATLSNKVQITAMGGSTIDVPVSGAIVRPAVQLPDMMTLGTFCIGQPTSPTSITYISTGTATITVDDVTLMGGASSPFTLVKTIPSTYPSSLTPNGGTATVLVTPKRVDNDGSITMDLEEMDKLVWDDDFESPVTDLTVKYVLDGGAIAPGLLDFGDVPIRIAVDNGKAVTVQNCSTDPLQLLEPTVPSPFELTNQFPTMLGPADRATFSIAFHPTEVGIVSTELSVMSTDGMEFKVALVGNGIAEGGGTGDDTGSLDETSFYACGCRGSSDPSGVLVIALAVCALVVRRSTLRVATRRCAPRRSRDLRRRT